MHEAPEQVAVSIMNLAGTHGRGTYEPLISALRKLGRDPDLRERVAVGMSAVAGGTRIIRATAP